MRIRTTSDDSWVKAFFGSADHIGFYGFRGGFGNIADAYRRAAPFMSLVTGHAGLNAEPDVVVRVVANGHEVGEPEVVSTSGRFDALGAGTEIELFMEPILRA